MPEAREREKLEEALDEADDYGLEVGHVINGCLRGGQVQGALSSREGRGGYDSTDCSGWAKSQKSWRRHLNLLYLSADPRHW